MPAEPHAEHPLAIFPPAATHVWCPPDGWTPTEHPRTGEVTRPVPQDPTTHRVVLIVEVDEPTDLSTADLVAMADVLREAAAELGVGKTRLALAVAAELAPDGITRASVELGVVDPEPPSPRPPSNAGTVSHNV